MYAAVRIRGTVGIRREVRDTLNMLRLSGVNSCSILQEDPTSKGMLGLVKDWITYGEVDKETLVALMKKRLRLNGNKRVDENVLKKVAGFDSFDAFADALISSKTKLKSFEQLQPFFRLTPPSKGFASIKEHYPKGDLGYRGKEIKELLERMM